MALVEKIQRMNLLRIVSGQVIRFMTVAPSEGQTLYGINLVRAFEDRYGFLVSPKTVEEFDLNNGITFRHGFFNKKTVVAQVKIYNNGILAEGAASTNEFYDFISDIVEWASTEAGLSVVPDQTNSPLYHSIVHVSVNIDLGKYVAAVTPILSLIDEKLRSYGSYIPDFQMTGMTFQSSIQGRTPTPFNIERLVNAPFKSNFYFSTSSLKTSDHLEVVAAVENAFTA
jgi:hypothetical protein